MMNVEMTSRRSKPHRVFPDGLILVLEALVALSAIPAGLLLAVKPDGSLIGLPTEILRGSPFPSFLVPGLVLALIVGGSSFTALVAVLIRHPRGRTVALGSGLLLIGWIAMQVILIGYQGFLQPLLLSIGILIVILSRVREKRVDKWFSVFVSSFVRIL